ncbi:MAG TPA: hypothetical protein VMS32_06795 [Verrucomicrobiae bacterium]|nr:hypothetical protein [Verrucomicrobiae bacterium]
MNGWVLGGTTFVASAVEMVEAATIVMAVGFTQGWRVALTGAAWALAALGLIIALLGPLLASQAAVARLEVVVGPLLVLFGIAWLRKAIWRLAGRKALHDEKAIYDREVAALQTRDRRVSFATSFQGVFVEGLEVAVIVVTFAATQPRAIAYSVGGAIAAAVVVLGAAVALRAPLSRVPENAMKTVVGLMLLSLGTMWTGEGLGVAWWAGDTTLFWLIGGYAIIAALLSVARRARRVAT